MSPLPRTWDIAQRIIAAFALLPASVIVVLTALLIRLTSIGPVFVCQQREGYQGRLFRMLKLRTMIRDADAYLEHYLSMNPEAAAQWKAYGCLTQDPRIPCVVARLARRYSIDELPQLLNVVLGDMNLVGPRPLPAYVSKRMRRLHRETRWRLRPGMTGLWQVSGRSEKQIKDMGRIDYVYAKRRSVALDVYILLRTLPAVVSARGAY
jgi:lipopolysaccharide/colanic/teichoic acid biosynthesis glycosyltransferase